MAGVIPSPSGGANPWARAINGDPAVGRGLRTVLQNQQYNAGLANALARQNVQTQGTVDVANRQYAPQVNQAIGAEAYAEMLGVTPGGEYAPHLQQQQMSVNAQLPTEAEITNKVNAAKIGAQVMPHTGKVAPMDKNFMQRMSYMNAAGKGAGLKNTDVNKDTSYIPSPTGGSPIKQERTQKGYGYPGGGQQGAAGVPAAPSRPEVTEYYRNMINTQQGGEVVPQGYVFKELRQGNNGQQEAVFVGPDGVEWPLPIMGQ